MLKILLQKETSPERKHRRARFEEKNMGKEFEYSCGKETELTDFHSRKLEVLLMTVELGSFTRAAEVIGYTQSGLTHMMDSLERELNVKLLERGHNGVRLTRAGKELLPAIRDFLRANAALDNAIKKVTRTGGDTIRVGAYASIAINWLPDILYKFRGICPETDVDLRMIDNAVIPYELLEKGEMDLIFASRQEVGNYDWIPLYSEPMYAVLPENYPVKDEKKFDIREFEGKEFIMPYGSFDLDVKKALKGVVPAVRPATVDDSAVIRLVEHGLGISLMAELMLKGRNKNVRCIPIDPPAVRELGMAVRSRRETTANVRKLIDCVLDSINRDVPS